MTITGPRLADSDIAQGFLTDMAERRNHVREAIDGALDRLAELPVGDGLNTWKPDAPDVQGKVDQAKAIAEVYVRGLLACGLVVDGALERDVFYTGRDFAVRGERVNFTEAYGPLGVGVLLRVNDALTASRPVFAFLDDYPFFDGFHDGHAEVLMHLIDMASKAAGDRLRDAREGQV
jgi:hypothetical protein